MGKHGAFWLHARTYCLNLTILIFFLFWHIFSKESFVWIAMDFFLSPNDENSTKKEHWLQ
jgi:hypothetical protein